MDYKFLNSWSRLVGHYPGLSFEGVFLPFLGLFNLLIIQTYWILNDKRSRDKPEKEKQHYRHKQGIMFSESSLPNCAKKLSSFSLQAPATASYTSRESGIILLQYQHTKARNCRNHMGKSFSFPIISDCIVRQKTFDHSNNLFFWATVVESHNVACFLHQLIYSLQICWLRFEI